MFSCGSDNNNYVDSRKIISIGVLAPNFGSWESITQATVNMARLVFLKVNKDNSNNYSWKYIYIK